MEKQMLISVPKACSEKWNSFTSTSDGNLCATCSKVVVDFTVKSENEILDYLNQKKEKVCGRFHANQLNALTTNQLPYINPGWRLLALSFIILISTVVSKPSFANPLPHKVESKIVTLQAERNTNLIKLGYEYSVKGIVRDEEGVALVGVNIYLKGTTIGTFSDANGKFEFPQKLKEGDIIVFRFIGLKTREYSVPNQAKNEIEIILAMDDTEIMGEVVVDQVYQKQSSHLAKWWGKVKSAF
jgi:hypothetical protein